MIRIFFILVVTILISCNVFSQGIFGVKFGLNYVNNVVVSDDFSPDASKFRIAYHFGFYSSIKLNDKISISPELLYSDKGETYENEGINVHLSYLNLPVLLDYNLLDNLIFRFGPELGYLISAKERREGKLDVSDFWSKKIDFGLSGGIKYLISDNFNTELRYTHGLTSVANFKDFFSAVSPDPILDFIGSNYEVSYQNRTFQISIGYLLK